MIDPSVFSNVPFKNPTAWSDFVGTHWLYHRALAEHVTRTTGAAYRVYPIGDGGSDVWQHAVEQTYVNACNALGVSGPGELAGFDLTDENDFASFTFLISQTLRRLREAAGLN